jgi:hypothetical protein
LEKATIKISILVLEPILLSYGFHAVSLCSLLIVFVIHFGQSFLFFFHLQTKRFIVTREKKIAFIIAVNESIIKRYSLYL